MRYGPPSLIPPARRRYVHSDIPTAKRKCLFCLSAEGDFRGEEHVIPRSLGSAANRYVIPPGGVCDTCNHWLGQQVDAPFTDRFDMKLTRGLENARGRSGVPSLIEGHNAVARLDVEIDGGKVELYAARVDPWGEGGLEIELEPKLRDPPDVVARTIRALWKIALGAFYLAQPERAISPEWDYLRHAVLGAPFKGFLLQAPFMALVTRQIAINANFDAPADPWAMTFRMGGVALAVPLANQAKLVMADARRDGWEIHSTQTRAPTKIQLRLDPSQTLDRPCRVSGDA